MDREALKQVVREVLEEEHGFGYTPIASRYSGGRLVIEPRDASLQPKEIPIDTFFHKKGQRGLFLEIRPVELCWSPLPWLGITLAPLVYDVVAPALADGLDVVTDRYLHSSLAYQGAGRELGIDTVHALSTFAVDGVLPDLVVLLDVDAATTAVRLDRALDRIEQAGEDFHARVVAAYRSFAEADPERWLVVDGSGAVDEVAQRLQAAVSARLA